MNPASCREFQARWASLNATTWSADASGRGMWRREMTDGVNESPDGAVTGANPFPRVCAFCPVEVAAGQRLAQHGQLEPPH